jgi:hypothetical protein
LLSAFIAAARSGDVAGLEALFAADIVSTSDGGGFVTATRVPVVGRERVAKFFAAAANFLWNGLTLSWIDANGQPGALLLRQSTVVVLVTIETSAGGIDQIRWMMRPSKLAALATFARQAPPPLVS